MKSFELIWEEFLAHKREELNVKTKHDFIDLFIHDIEREKGLIMDFYTFLLMSEELKRLVKEEDEAQ